MRGSVVVQLHRSCTSKASLVRAMNSPIGLGTWWGVGKKNIVKGHRVFSEGTVHSRTTGIPSTRYRSPVHQKRYIYSNGIFSFFFFLFFSLSLFFFEEALLGFSKKLRSSWDPCLRFRRVPLMRSVRSSRTNSSVGNSIFKRGFKILYIYYTNWIFYVFYGGKA